VRERERERERDSESSCVREKTEDSFYAATEDKGTKQEGAVSRDSGENWRWDLIMSSIS
jgi:hypothetical protein